MASGTWRKEELVMIQYLPLEWTVNIESELSTYLSELNSKFENLEQV